MIAPLFVTLRTQLADAQRPGLAGVRALDGAAQTVVALEDAVRLMEQRYADKECVRLGHIVREGMTPTQSTQPRHYLVQPGDVPKVEDCGFRMLQPHEIQAAMAFPADYKVLGTKREQVRQLGNAVTPPAILMQRIVETFG